MKIYIAGRRGAGKTTAAEILRRRGAVVVKITTPLYEVCSRYFGMVAKDRLLLQRVGDAFRAVDPVWLARRAAEEAEERGRETGAPILVVEGVRTREEAEYLNSRGWTGVLVEAPEAVRLARRTGEPQEADLHLTEAGVDSLPVAVRVFNPGTVAGLEAALEAALFKGRGPDRTPPAPPALSVNMRGRR